MFWLGWYLSNDGGIIYLFSLLLTCDLLRLQMQVVESLLTHTPPKDCVPCVSEKENNNLLPFQKKN